MVTKTFNVSLDINSSIIKRTNYELVSGDVEVYSFEIRLYNGTDIQDLSNIDHAWIIFRKADRNIVQGVCSITSPTTNGILTYDLGSQEIAYPGNVEAELQLYGASNELITSSKFNFTVRKSLYNDEAVESSSQYNILTSLITNVNQAENSRTISENTRQSQETTRQVQETVRQTNTTNAINTLNTVINTQKVIPKPAVGTYANIATTYPNPQVGWLVHVTDDGKEWRYDGNSWVNTSVYSNTALDAVVAQITAASYSTPTLRTPPFHLPNY